MGSEVQVLSGAPFPQIITYLEGQLYFTSLKYLKLLLKNSQGRGLILWAPVALGCGISFYFQLPFDPHWAWSLVCPTIFLGGLFLRMPHLQWLRLWYFLILGSLGFSIVQMKVFILSTPVLKKTVFIESLEGIVQDIEHTTRGLKLTLQVSTLKDFPQGLEAPKALCLRLNGKKNHNIYPGSIIKAQAKIFPVEGALVPGGFDFKRKAYFLGIGGSGIIYKIHHVEGSNPKKYWSFWVKNLREKITNTLHKTLAGPEGAIASALITGEKGKVPSFLRDAFADVGIAHILAISGLHLSLVGGLIFFTIRRGLALVPFISLKYNMKKWAAFLSIFVAFFYLQISGGAVPIQRAFLMFLAAMGAVLWDRQILTLRSVALAAFGILLAVPESLMMPSFQLSFAAVVSLIAIYENGFFQNFLQRDQGYFKRIFFYILSMMGTTVVASLATLPFTIYHFHKFTGLGLLGNLMAIPLLSFWIMPWGILTVILMPFDLTNIPMTLMGKGIHWMISGATFITSHWGFIYRLPHPPIWGFSSGIFGGLFLCLLQGKKRFLGFIGLGIFFISLFFKNVPQIYISADLKTIGFINEKKQLAINKSRRHTFMGDVWASWAGVSKVIRFQDTQEVQCSKDSCSFTIKEKKVLYLKNIQGFSEESNQADILISAEPLRFFRKKCTHPQFIMDRFDGWKKGPHVIWIDQPLKILSLHQAGGRRWG